MTGPEKAYFRKCSNTWKKGEKAYLKLFEHIVHGGSYDEAQCRRIMGFEENPGQYAVAKHGLHQLILRSLRAFRLKANPRAGLHARVEDVELLIDRGLHQQAAKRLRSAKREAKRGGELLILAELIRLEQHLTKVLAGKDHHSQLAALIQEGRENLRRINIDIELQHLHNELFAYFSLATDQRGPNEEQAIEAIIQHPLLASPDPPDFFSGTLHFYTIHANYTRMQGDVPGFKTRMNQLVKAWEQHPTHLARKPAKYFIHLSTFLDACIHQGDFDTYEAHLEKLQNPTLRAKVDPAFFFQTELQLALRYCLNKPAPSRALELQSQLQIGLNQYAEQIREQFRIAFYYNIMVLLFIAGHFKASHHWARTILSHPETGLRRDIRYVARIFSIVLHFERGDWEGLEYDLSRSARFFQRKGKWFDFEQTVIRHLRRIIDSLPVDVPREWSLFQKALEALPCGGLIGYEEILKWVEGKCEQKAP